MAPKKLFLKVARRQKRWSQKRLEAASGVKQAAISALERGDVRDPRNSTVEALEIALGLPRGTLLFPSTHPDQMPDEVTR